MESVLYTGAAFGLALGTSIFPFGRKQSAEKWLVCGLLIIGALAVASIARQHQLSAADEGRSHLRTRQVVQLERPGRNPSPGTEFVARCGHHQEIFECNETPGLVLTLRVQTSLRMLQPTGESHHV